MQAVSCPMATWHVWPEAQGLGLVAVTGTRQLCTGDTGFPVELSTHTPSLPQKPHGSQGFRSLQYLSKLPAANCFWNTGPSNSNAGTQNGWYVSVVSCSSSRNSR